MSESSSSTTKLVKTVSELAESPAPSTPSTQSINSLLADCTFSTPTSSLSPSLISTPRSDKYSDSIDTMMLSTSLNDENYSQEINSFLKDFNKKFDVTANSVHDIIDIVSTLLQRKNKTNMIQEKLNKQIQDLQSTNFKLTSENDQLRFQLADLQSKSSNAEHLCTNLTNQNNALKDTNNTLQEEIKTLKASLTSMQDIMEGQIQDLQNLGKQRIDLITICNKQTNLYQKLESCMKAKVPEPVVKKEIPKIIEQKPDLSQEHYQIIASMIKIIDECIKTDSNPYKSIRDDSNFEPKERIMRITKLLVENYKQEKQLCSQYEQDKANFEKKSQTYQKKCFEILTLFEGQLDFLQKLSHSTDLQNALLYKEKTATSVILSDDDKTVLMRKCANLRKFVDETFINLSQSKIEDIMNTSDSTETIRVFDLLNTDEPDNLLNKVLSSIGEKTDVDIREIFDLFRAQLFMNCLLKNHISDMHIRVARIGQENTSLKKLLQETREKDIVPVKLRAEDLERKYMKIRNFLSKFVPVDDVTPTLTLIKRAMNVVKNTTEESNAAVEMAEKLKKELDTVTKERDALALYLKKSQKDNNKTNKESTKLSKQTKTELAKAQEELAQIKEQCTKFTDEIQALTKTVEDKNAELQKNKEDFERQMQVLQDKILLFNEEKKQNDEKQAALISQVEEDKKVIETTKKQRNALKRKLDQTVESNKNIADTMEKQSNAMKENYTATINSLQSQYEASLKELENQQASMMDLQSKCQQLTSENSKLRVENKTLEMKVKMFEGKSLVDQQNIQSRITAQVTAAQMENANIISSLKQVIEETKNGFQELFGGRYIIHELSEAVDLVQKELSQLSQKEIQYGELLEEFEKTKNVLGITTNDFKLNEIVSNMMKQIDELKLSLEDSTKKYKQNQDDVDKFRKEIRKSENQLSQLRAWENWSRRIYSVINDMDSLNMSNDEMRLVLEEALLASVSHKSIFFRTDMLRTEKNLMVKFDKRILNTRSVAKPTFRAVLIATLAARRVFKLGGAIPLNIHDSPISFYETPKRKNSVKNSVKKSVSSSKKKSVLYSSSMRKSVIPMWA
ncbi:hypothetical protein TVAG_234170 [Trichomonas vaginalis G3]|uniref:Uncharacterized protein n=1 Tax=Trichomonas vaginalis (strain ATCC PRA-98 / G3) TaxID=412133 RepID=A2FXP5_TRIV3|nr:centrosomal protein 2 family [Trichomonas vaginalis G3]EAX90324.1 hypothetical protein TVAG_234170 [Trichomonas vaginalis G3]KAI5548141.1 centrosomal protein 2 family [Trichomonas vaginalis G3]|eukprot:XP_001303254.1 hypothetical protein [Trichomonas vaginalis G3]